MANHHINGKDPYIMTPEEAKSQKTSWEANGGYVRDHSCGHPGHEDPHMHFAISYKTQDTDILVKIRAEAES